jgi:dimethylglycine dehydrogenase
MKSHAQVVIIGGGAVGCSALYHLTQLGVTDAVLLERDELTAGSTWHAAGNCPNFSTSWNLIKLQRHSTRLYAELAQRVGYDINYHVTGSIRLAHTQDRVDEFRHVVSQARAQGIEFDMMTPAEIRARHPFIGTEGILAGLYDPHDGDIDPAQLTQALAKGARDAGAQIHRQTRVTAIERTASGEWRLTTNKGVIQAQKVINAAGYRGGEVAAMVGEYLPIVTLSHQYLVTEDIPELVARGAARLPLVRDPDVSYYMRQERQGLILGPYEWQATAHWLNGIPDEFANQLFDDDTGRIEKYIEAACDRVRARWQSTDRARARAARIFPLLRFHFRHRAGRRRRQDHCRMGRPRTAGVGHVAARFAALHGIREPQVHARQGDRNLPARIRHRLSGGGAARRAARQGVAG